MSKSFTSFGLVTVLFGYDLNPRVSLCFCVFNRVGVLVLSSCYMAFKIVDLEQRLNSLVSTGEHMYSE